ncbi:MAG: acyl--CoA ligase [Ruminococcaceae bacterium]|nr:acyl--CoA ligase [Oscillospiraceae bacterium]
METPLNQSCYEYLVQNSNRIGDFVALTGTCGNVRISRFIKDVDLVAAYLSAAGVKQGDVCTIFMPTCGQAFVAFYALSKIGAVANIVHPLLPPEAIDRILTNVGSKFVFVLDMLISPYESVIKKHRCHVILCSLADYAKLSERPLYKLAAISKRPAKTLKKSTVIRYIDIINELYKIEDVPVCKCNAKETSVYLHGGGTTGKSKTIMLSAFAINSVAFKINDLDVPHEVGRELSLVVLPIFHAFGLAVAMHFSLCAGYGCITMHEFNAKKANDLIKKYPVAFIVGVPNMFKKMHQEANFKGPHLRRLRLLFSGGDTVSESFVDVFNATLAEYGGMGRLMRGYGLTEVASVCCVNNYNAYRENSIGMPLKGMEIEIWDENQNSLSRNTIGEIVVTGDTMMNGYFQDDAVQDDGIYTDENGKKWIMTGDLGYKDKDGFIFFTGRKKRMIVISGYNVYPYNIESEVLKLKYISEACAVQGYVDEKPIVKLYVTLREPVANTKKVEEEIREYCEKTLDKFSVPRKVVVLDAFPRTKMAKIDFLKLTDPVPQSAMRGQRDPIDPNEQRELRNPRDNRQKKSLEVLEAGEGFEEENKLSEAQEDKTEIPENASVGCDEETIEAQANAADSEVAECAEDVAEE